jgi:hypothetical protein
MFPLQPRRRTVAPNPRSAAPARDDRRIRREIAVRHERLSHQHEVGGSWSDLP